MPTITKERYSTGVLMPPPQQEHLDVQALLISEGPVQDGRDKEFTVEELEAIAAATNEYILSGEDAPLFLSNHDEGGEYSSKDIVGLLQPGLAVAIITEETLPHPGMTDLIGKHGLFGTVKITHGQGIERYRSGVKKLSVGLGMLGEHIIYEVSVVPWGAVRGASMFSWGKYGLTIADTQKQPYQLNELWESFVYTLEDIQTTPDDLLMGQSREALTSKAIEDMASMLRQRLDVPPMSTSPMPMPTTAPIPTLPPSNFNRSRNMPDDQSTETIVNETVQPEPETFTPQSSDGPSAAETMARRENAELKREIEQLKRRNRTSGKYAKLRRQAEALVQTFKLTPVQFGELFSNDPDGDVEKFAVENGDIELGKIEFMLSHIEQYGQAIAPVCDKGDLTVLSRDSDDMNAQYDAELEAFNKSRGIA